MSKKKKQRPRPFTKEEALEYLRNRPQFVTHVEHIDGHTIRYLHPEFKDNPQEEDKPKET